MTVFEMVNRLVGGLLPEGLTSGSAQSKFLYSSGINRSVVDRRIGDIAVYAGLTKSQVIEEALIGSLLPPDGSTAAQYVNHVLHGFTYVQVPESRKLKKEDYHIQQALGEIFARNCSGVKEAYHDNLEPLVVLTREILPKCGTYFTMDGDPIGLRKFACKKMYQWLNAVREAKGLDKLPQKLTTENTSMYGADYYLLQLEKEDPQILPFNYIVKVLDEWDVSKGLTATYGFLAAFLDVLHPWDDRAYDRIAFQKACEEVMTPWDEEKADKPSDGIELKAVSFGD